MPLERPSAGRRTCALFAQRTRIADMPAGSILTGLPGDAVVASMHPLPGGTLIGVFAGIINKRRFRIYSLTAACVQMDFQQITHMGVQAPLLTGAEVLRRSVLPVGHHGGHFAARILLVLLHQVHQLPVFLK